MTPRVSLVAFESREPGFIFVAVPNERGRYVRTDKSVALVSCPHCLALVGEPCQGATGYGGSTHAVRRARALAAYGRGHRAEDVEGLADPAAPGCAG